MIECSLLILIGSILFIKVYLPNIIKEWNIPVIQEKYWFTYSNVKYKFYWQVFELCYFIINWKKKKNYTMIHSLL